MPSPEYLTQERLKSVMRYDAITGKLEWINSGGHRSKNPEPGLVCGGGYRRITVDGRFYAAHRLAWLYVYGAFPAKQLDHIDGNKLNNAISNLREVTASLNQLANQRPRKMNATGYTGVVRRKNGKFKAQIKINYKSKYLGIFETAELAREAYLKAHREMLPDLYSNNIGPKE